MSKASDMAAGLRALAADIESGAMPMPYNIEVNTYWDHNPVDDHGYQGLGAELTQERCREVMNRTPGNWRKKYNGSYLQYVKEYANEFVTVVLAINRATVCRKVVTGTKEIPAVPARTVEVVDWICDDNGE